MRATKRIYDVAESLARYELPGYVTPPARWRHALYFRVCS